MAVQGSYVDGRFVVEAGDDGRENVNPSQRSDVIGRYAQASPALVDEAVAAARAAQPAWAALSPQDRADLLEGVARRILDDVEPLADLLAREEGKTLPEARGEVTRAGHIFRFFAGEAVRLTGEIQDSTRPGVRVATHREPLGVVGIITPWNFPIAIPAWKLAPALAYGNTAVLKPADLVPASAVALFSILDSVGFPAGVANLVLGPGRTVGDRLTASDALDAITFTGSEAIGTQIARVGTERLMPVQLEMGGKNPLLVAADADLDLAVECATNGAYFSTGQRCTASSRIIVDRRIADRFTEKLVARMQGLTVGDSRAPGTEIRPVVDERQLASNLGHLEAARALPGVEIIGGETSNLDVGNFQRPALVLNAEPRAAINQDEVFGPVASLIVADDHDHAVHLANDVAFGLTAGICTQSLRLADDFRRRAQAGMVMVNLPTAGVDPHVSFGGRKRSSFGPKEQGAHAREFFTQLKIEYVRS